MFKTLESQIKRINFEFLYIDNAQLKMPYLIEQNEHLLVKNILQYQNIRQILKQFDLEDQKIIFLNFENHKFLNSKYNDLNNSAPLLIETFVRTRHILTELALTSSIVVICLMHFTYSMKTGLSRY